MARLWWKYRTFSFFYVTLQKVTKSIHARHTNNQPYSKTRKETEKLSSKEQKKNMKLLVQADKTTKKPLNKEARQRSRRASKKPVKQNSKTSTTTGKQYSITNFVIYSLSQMNMHRSLPRRSGRKV